MKSALLFVSIFILFSLPLRAQPGNDSSAASAVAANVVIPHRVIVIIGSSTAAGAGPAAIDSAWVWRYRRFVQSVDTAATVIDLAVRGYSTYECMPTGFVPPAGVAASQPNANITKALSYNPSAIIVNLPSNDASMNNPLAETLKNFAVIASNAAEHHVPIWVTTSQGRRLSAAGRQLLIATRDSILAIYKDHAIDFWTGLSDSSGRLLPQYDSGDGVHMNSDAHRILCERVVAARILERVEFASIEAASLKTGVRPPRPPMTSSGSMRGTLLMLQK